MKKILSIVLAVALCLTAMVGCLTVSADGAATATVATVEVDAGTATADVAITIAGDAIAATYIDVALPELALVGVASATDGLNAMHNSVNAEGVEDFTVADAANAIRILLDSAEGIVDYNSLSVVLTFNTANAAAGEYAVTVTGSDAADSNEAAVVISPVAGAVVVKEVVSEPVLDENITVTASASITDTLGAAFFVKVAQLTAYDHYTMEITQQKYDSDYNEYTADTIVVSDFTAAGSTQKYYRFTGVAMYELGLDIKVVIKCYDADNNLVAYSNDYTQSIADIVKALYASTSKETTKYLVTDLLNLGAEAQAYFGAKKTASDLYAATPVNEGFDQTYATADVGTLNNINSTVYADAAPITNTLTTSVSLTSSPAVAYLFKNTGVDKANLRMELTYHSNYLGGGSDVTATVVGDDWQTVGTFYRYDFTKTCLYDGNKTVTAEIYYNDQLVLTNQYSVDTYTANTASTSAAYAVMQAISKFGVSTRAYFGTT